MSILSTIFKAKRYIKTDNGYQLFSEWQKASEVEFNNGSDAETTLGAINGITSSLNTNNDNYALSAAGGYNLQSQVTKLNTNLSKAITTSNIGSQSVNYANSAGTATTAKYATYATAKYNGNPSPLCVSLSESQVQFVWNTSVMRVDVYVDKTYIGHIVTN